MSLPHVRSLICHCSTHTCFLLPRPSRAPVALGIQTAPSGARFLSCISKGSQTLFTQSYLPSQPPLFTISYITPPLELLDSSYALSHSPCLQTHFNIFLHLVSVAATVTDYRNVKKSPLALIPSQALFSLYIYIYIYIYITCLLY